MSTIIQTINTIEDFRTNLSAYIASVVNDNQTICFQDSVAIIPMNEWKKYQKEQEQKQAMLVASSVWKESLEYKGDDDLINWSKIK